MKKIYLIIVAALLFAALPVRAQLTTTLTTIAHDSTFAQGRDFWFAEQSNYWGTNLGGKYMRVYITSPNNCIAYVESIDGGKTSVAVTANTISSYDIPQYMEVESSGVVENKAIHVYCNTSDLTVYTMSHNEANSDGSHIIPSIGWGTDYVVAAYESLLATNATYTYDLPSTCVIVANEDSTSVNITPSTDCREGTSSGGPPPPYLTFYPKGQTFTVVLDRGQCMQLMPVTLGSPEAADDSDSFDLTGTIIHSTLPVGVLGGASTTQIPSLYMYANHVEDMIPAVRTWGKTYFATNPIDSVPNHDRAQYLFISSETNQAIFRHSCDSSDHSECVIPNQDGIYWDEIAGAQKFFSDQPFLVVEYINSSLYPDSIDGQGKPAEVRLNPREQFTKTVEFQAPPVDSDETPYLSYANITVNANDAKKTLFDGKSISDFSFQCIDTNWKIFTIPNVTVGVHTVMGDDSGVGVTVYGYGLDEAYAWSSSSGVATFQSPDSIAPRATISTQCFYSSVHLSDSGAQATGLDMIRVDSDYNMTFLPDNNAFIEGSEQDTSGYSMYVTDPSKPATLIVSVFDAAGNHTTITSAYTAVVDTMQPLIQNLGTWVSSKPANTAYDTLYNRGTTIFDVSELHLLKGNVGFSLFDSIGGALDLSPLAPGERRLIQIQFEAVDSVPAIDSIIYGNACGVQSVAVIGSGGAVDFFITDQSWPDELLGNCYSNTVLIENLSSASIIIDSVWWADTIHFKAVSTLPIIVPPSPGYVPFALDYCPDSNSFIMTNRSQASWFSPQVLEADGKTESPRYDSLIGWAAAPSSVGNENNSTQATILPTIDGRSIEIILPTNLNGTVTFELVNVLGESVLHESLGTGTQNVDASSLPRGVYFYRITSGAMNQSGKVNLGK